MDQLLRKRPRGLWKGHPQFGADTSVSTLQEHSDPENDEPDTSTVSSDRSKRQKCSNSPRSETDSFFFDYSRQRELPNLNLVPITSRLDEQTDRALSGYQDWEDLKELFARAVELYENDNSAEDALPLLRGIVHECRRFLILYQDPSVLFTNNSSRHHTTSPEPLTPPNERLARDWGHELETVGLQHGTPSPHKGFQDYAFATDSPIRPNRILPDLPTAFHALLGTTLFLFGNLIAQNPAHALPGEPAVPCPYWLAALDVFETGENIPSRTNGQGRNVGEDWRMAIIWGRTLVCLADEAVTRAIKAKDTGMAESYVDLDEPKWPPESPLSAITAQRPPSTRRISLSWASAHDLMVLAMDQFSRGIFHMPHPQHQLNALPSSASEHFSRPKELFTIASEVLGVAERLEDGVQRQHWASSADSVFSQMKMEADMDIWRGPITRARGRCWLIIGSSRAELIEADLEKGDMQVFCSEAAQDARDALAMAISFFDRAKGSASSWHEPESQELQPLITETLLTLANLTADENKREELYSRAQAESENQIDLDECGDKMDQSN